MAANRYRSTERKSCQVPEMVIKKITWAHDAEPLVGTVQEWLDRFGSDRYILLGPRALIQDLTHLVDPILLPIAEAYSDTSLRRLKHLAAQMQPDKAEKYRSIISAWERRPGQNPEPHRSVLVSHRGRQVAEEACRGGENDGLLASRAFLFQNDVFRMRLVDKDFGNERIGPPTATLQEAEPDGASHTLSLWSFCGAVPDYRWARVEKWSLSMGDYETLRRIGVKATMFLGGDLAQRLSTAEATLLEAVFQAVEEGRALVSAPYDGFAEEGTEDWEGEAVDAADVDLDLVSWDEEMDDGAVAEAEGHQSGQGEPGASAHGRMARPRRRASQLERRKRRRLENHEKAVHTQQQRLMQARKRRSGAPSPFTPSSLRTGMQRVWDSLVAQRRARAQMLGVKRTPRQNVSVLRSEQPNVAHPVRAQRERTPSPVRKRRLEEMETEC